MSFILQIDELRGGLLLMNFPLYSAFVPTAEDMKLSPRAFHRKMCSGQDVAGRGAGSEFNFWSEQQREGLIANA